MTFAIIALVGFQQAQAITVPPQVKFQAGSQVRRHGTLTAQPCDSDQKISQKFVLVATAKRAGLTVLSMGAEGDKKLSDYELRTNAKGLPLSCKPVGQTDDGQGLNELLFVMREPLWPAGRHATFWTATLPNPVSDKAETMNVACSGRMVSGSLVLEQKTKPLAMQRGISVQLTSTLNVNPRTGMVSSVHENVDFLSGGKKTQVITYEEHG